MIKEYKYLFIALLIWSVIGLYRIDAFPMVNSDESWDLGTPYTFLTKGSFSDPMLRSSENAMKQSMAIVRVEPKIMHQVLMIPIGFVFGISVLTGRLLSFASAFLTIIIVFLLLKRHIEARFALLGCILLMTESLFWIVSRGFRPEIEVIFLLSLCFYLIDLLEIRDKLLYWFALGLCLGLSFWTHPNILFLFFGFLLYFFIRHGLALFRTRGFYIMLLGVLSGFLPYAIFVLHSGIDHFMAQTMGRTSALTSLNALLSSIRSEPKRYLTIIQFPKRFFIVLIEVISLIYLFRLGKRDKVFLSMGIVSIFYLVLLSTIIDFKSQRYPAILLLPAIVSFTVILSSLYQRGYKNVVMALALIFILNNIAGSAYLIHRDKRSDFNKAMRELRGSIPVQSRIIGHPILWLGLKESDYIWVSGLTPDYINGFKPDYLALINLSSPYLKERTIVKTKDVSTPETTHISYERAVDYAKTHNGKLIKVIEAGDYGPIEVYKVSY